MKILIIIPAYNEQENILTVCNIIKKYNRIAKQKFDFVVINDGSKDDTEKILVKNKLNHVNLVHNLGIGGAVQTGYRYAYQHGYDIAVQFDGDGQHDINYVEKICNPLISGKADMCIGSRYLKKGVSKFQSTFMRRLGAKLITGSIRFNCKKKITDPTSGFRAANKQIIKLFANEYPVDYPEPESTAMALAMGYRVTEVPVSMNERIAGKSFVNPLTSIDYMVKVTLAIPITAHIYRRRRK